MPHINEKIDFCSEVFVVFKNKVLLRKHDKFKIWLSVGGHIELDEDPNVAAIREVKEEVGLDVVLYKDEGAVPSFLNETDKSLIPPQFMLFHPINEKHSHVVFVYFGTSNTDQLVLSETEITEDCRWFTKEDLVKNDCGISEKVQFHALKALEKLTNQI